MCVCWCAVMYEKLFIFRRVELIVFRMKKERRVKCAYVHVNTCYVHDRWTILTVLTDK